MERLGRMKGLTSKMFLSREEHLKQNKQRDKHHWNKVRGEILKEAV